MSSVPAAPAARARVTPEIHAAGYAAPPAQGSMLPGSWRFCGAGRNGCGAAVPGDAGGAGGVGTSLSRVGARPAWYGPSAAVSVPRIRRSIFRPRAPVIIVSQNSQMLQAGLPGSGLL